MKLWITLIGCMLLINISTAHPWKANNYVVIDTDGGVDDMRAISLLLASSSVQVLAITTSSGAVDALSTYWKVKSLLQQYKHQGILVGVNKNNFRDSDFAMAHNFSWGDSLMNMQTAPVSYTDVLDRVASYSKEPLSFINLGSLNTLNSYLQYNPEFSKRIKKALWPVNSDFGTSYNYKIDTAAFSNLKKQKINLQLVAIPSGKYMYSEDICNALAPLKGIYATNYFRSVDGSTPHFLNLMYDELLALHLNNEQTDLNTLSVKQISDLLVNLLNNDGSLKNQAFSTFPTDTSAYLNDIGQIMQPTLEKYGAMEWNACVLTSELHRHVGIYALIGAKMGIRAREYFGCGADELKVISYAGSKPPISCMNDGIQVSTGATIGHGLITISTEEQKAPKATFEYLGQQVTLELKAPNKEQLKQELKQLVTVYGISSNIYWDLVREIALGCWEKWDRNEIFTLNPIE